MGKRSAFDDSDEEEPYPAERIQETPQPVMGQAPSNQMTRAHVESSRKRNPSGQASGHQKRKWGDPEVVEVDPLSFSLPAIHELSSIDELLKEGYEDQGQGAGQFEGVPEGHALLTFDPPRVECADLPATGMPRLEDGMRQAMQAVNSFVTVCTDLERQLASARTKAASEAGKAREAEARLQALEEEKRRLEEDISTMRGQFEGMELAYSLQIESLQATSVPKSHLDKYILAEQIAETCPTVSKPEDIIDIPGSLSFVFQMPRGTQTPLRTPPGPNEEPETVGHTPPPKGHNSGSCGGGGNLTDSNTNSRDKVNDA
ncbi:OLC1v1031175C1 [Oldenlandia corymbosa var. corymbosa]|uniref:OLC1v1031175C1 n=1 Tax=Oldenlandia corymbosa var. corymbosa TaxID=529605 RepID=A0AAV1CKW0_OLDCO|nr:OLC1v1031175C1 [Oldenlandia corymbosa var. corymbosa]